MSIRIATGLVSARRVSPTSSPPSPRGRYHTCANVPPNPTGPQPAIMIMRINAPQRKRGGVLALPGD